MKTLTRLRFFVVTMMLAALPALCPMAQGDEGLPLPASAPAASGTAGAALPPAASETTDRLIVKYRDPAVAKAARLEAGRVQALSARAGVALTHMRRMSGNGQVFRLPKRMRLEDARAVAKRLSADPSVEYAVPDRRMYPAVVPNDPGYASQWHYKSPDPPDNEIAGINLPSAWDITTGSSGVVVGVIDTGIVGHADLQGRVIPGYNFISDADAAGNGVGRSADPSDLGDWVSAAESDDPASPFYGCPVSTSSWHGTHVTGTIGATSNNRSGVSGVNWASRILPVRVLGKCGGYTSDIVDGMRWAAGISVPGVPDNPNPANVINMSLGASWACDTAEQNAVNDLLAAGTTVVAAVGNSSADAANFSPASCSGVIAVAAVNRSGGLTYYSNYGQSVKIAAPGGEQFSAGDPNGVYSTLNAGSTTPVPSPQGDTYHYYQGTSQATPHVTGTVSLMLSVNPALTPTRILQLLQGMARPFPTATGSAGGDCGTAICGAGIVDAFQSVQAVASNAPVIGVSPLSLSFNLGSSKPAGQSLTIANPGGGTLSWKASGSAPWLRVSPTSGSNGGTVTVTVDPSRFDGPVPSSGTVTVSSAAAANPSVVVPVRLTSQLTPHAAIPTPVSDHAMATVNGKIYVIGGFGGGGSLVQIYDPVSDTWTTGAAKPTPSANINAAVINGKIYVPGGLNATTSAVLTTLEIYDPAANRWSRGASLPQPLEGSGVEAINGLLYVAGGQDSQHSYATTYVYDPTADEWKSATSMSYYRSFFGSGMIGGRLYAAGGYHYSGHSGSSGVVGYTEVYDPGADAWSSVGSMKTPRIDHGGAALSGKLYAFGGRPDLVNYLSSIEAYDPAAQSWSVMPYYLGKARASLKTVAVGNSIYVMGGYDGQNYSGLNESLDLAPALRTPTITWPTPAAIVYGTPLSAAQLDATADMAGSFAYDPPAGTILNAGSGQTLSVTFTPADPSSAAVTASVTIDVTKASAAVTLGGLAAVYDATPKAATVMTNPAGLAVSVTYNGSTAPPIAAGSYGVVATVSDPNYGGSASGILVIAKGAAVVTLGNLSAVYDGTPKQATATANPAGLAVALTYNGGTTAPTSAGSYTVAATVNDPNYGGSASGTLVIAKATPVVTWPTPADIPFGTPLGPTQLDATASTPGSFAYTPAAGTVPAAGSQRLTVSFTPTDGNDYASVSKSVLINVLKPVATVVLGSLAATYDGTPKPVTATTIPVGLAVSVTYNGSAALPTAAGSYNVVATVSDPNYGGSATGTFTIAKAGAMVILANLSAAYDGTPKSVTATTSPAGLTTAVTYNGSATPPTAAGSYSVVANVSDPNYSGRATGTLTVTKGKATVTLGSLSATYDGTPKQATATTSPAGMAVSFTYNGSATPPTAVGSYAVVASVNDPNYGGSAIGTLTIAKGSAAITLGNLSAAYDGTPKQATATTNPAGVAVSFTYNGSTTPPTAAGSYSVVATVSDPNYGGTASGTLVIAKATPVVTWPTPADIVYGTALGTAQLNASSTTPGTFAYTPAAGMVLGAGSQTLTVAFTPTDAKDYVATSKTVTLNVQKGAAGVTLGNLSAIYDATPKSATVTTNPAGLAVRITYNGSATLPTTAGSYAVVATVNDPNYGGSATGTLIIAKASAKVTLASLSLTYDGLPKQATATTVPAGMAVSFTYNGSATPPTAAGSYTVVATVSDTNYGGSASGTLTIAKGSATVTLGSLSAVYDGTPKPATATTNPAGLAVSFTYNGSPTLPTVAASYAVAAVVSDPNYSGTASGTLVIAKATPVVTWPTPADIVYGTALGAAQLNASSTTPGTFAYTPAAGTVLGAGSQTLTVAFTPTDTKDYAATSKTLTFNVQKAAAAVTLGSLSTVYDSTAKSATVTTNPAGLAVRITYNGSATLPTTAGSYAVAATMNDPNYGGTASGTLTIAKAGATVTLAGLSAVYDGTPKGATATTSPAGLAVRITYNGSATLPIAAGSYAVVATVNDPNYSGTASGTLTVAKAGATVTLAGLSAIYNGTPKQATATTSPAGLAVSFTYNGSATPPIAAGSYAVAATVTDPNYGGTASGTLVIAKAAATVTLGSLSATFDGTRKGVAVTTVPAGLAVAFTYNGSATSPIAAGSYAVVATVSDPNYGGTASGTFVIAKAGATVTLGSLSTVYDGTSKSATATTNPAGAAVAFTYNGSATPPTAVGSYTVVATISDPNYGGTAGGTLVIAKATPVVTWPTPADIVYGTALGTAQLNASSSTPGSFAYTPAAGTVLNAGSQALTVAFTPTDTKDYAATSKSVALNVQKGAATVTLGNLSAVYDGTSKAATATVVPAGFVVGVTYNGVASPPTAAGNYAVVATVSDANYSGTASGTLTIAKAGAKVALGSLSAVYDGAPKAVAAATTPAGLAVSVTYNGSATPPTAAGSYAVVATVNDPNYGGTASGTLTIAKAAATVTLGSLSATFDGTRKSVTATTVPAGLAVGVTYNGSPTLPVAVGSYAVAATVSDPNYSGSASGTLVITKGTATVSLGSLSATYDGTAKQVAATTAPAGLAVSIIYNGSATPPTAAGSYTVVATVSDPNYSGTASGTLTIARASATVTLGNLSAVYDGTPKAATATTSPAVKSVVFSYGGSAAPPIAAGNYAVVATVSDLNYSGTASGTLTIAKGSATVALGNLSAVYDGKSKAVTVATVPAGKGVSITYNGSVTSPIAAGSYAVVVTVNDPNYGGSASGTLVIAKAAAMVTLGSLSATYDGKAKSVTATTTPAGLAVAFTYNGSATPPIAAGSYAVVGTVNDPNYGGSASGTLTVAKAALTVTATAEGKPYGATDPVLAYTYSTLAAGDTASVFSGSLTRAPGEGVGSYPISLGTLSAGPNYAITFVGSLLAITPPSYTVGFVSGGNGSLSGTVSQTVVSGGSTTAVTAVPATGYHFVNWTGSTGFSSTANPLIVTNVAAGQTVTANFAVNTYTVIPASGAGGGMTPNALQRVNYGATVSFTVTPAANYRIASVGGCGGSLSGSTYTTGPVTANCVVSATFAKNPVAYSWTSAASNLEMGYKGGKKTISVTVTANGPATAAAVTASASAGWIDVAGNGASITLKKGKGSGKVTIGVSANASSVARNGVVLLNGQAITVTQAGAPCSIGSLAVSPSSLTPDGGTASVQVTAPDGCGWTVLPPASGAAWLSVGDPAATGSGSFAVTASPNHGSQVKGKYVKAKSRKGVLTVQSASGGKKSVTVSQAGD